MRDELIQKLFELQDVKYREFHSGLCPGTDSIIGVRIPLLRKLAKEIAKQDYRQFLAEVRNEYYEETMLEGLVIATAKMLLAERLELLKSFVPKIDNWAVCDCVCASFRFRPEDLPEAWQFILQYQKSEREFELRFMLIMMLNYFVMLEYLRQVLEVVDGIKNTAYYVKMAQAWLIAEIFIKHRDAGLEFLRENHLSAWVQNKAIQKIRESYRAAPADKQMLLKYKK